MIPFGQGLRLNQLFYGLIGHIDIKLIPFFVVVVVVVVAIFS